MFRQSPCVPKKTPNGSVSLASQMAFTCFLLLLVPGRAHRAQRAQIRELGSSDRRPHRFLGVVAIVFPAKHLKSSYWKKNWLVVYLPLWKMMSSSVGVTIPNWMESHKNDVPNHQPEISIQPASWIYLVPPITAFSLQHTKCHSKNTAQQHWDQLVREWMGLPDLLSR